MRIRTQMFTFRNNGLIKMLALLGCLLLLASAAPGTPRATAQAPQPLDATPIRVEGYLKAMSPGRWLIGDISMTVDEHTVFIEKRGQAEVGAWLVAWGWRDASGALYAELIQVDRPAGRSGPLRQFSAQVMKQSGQWWVIGETLVQVTDATQIIGAPGRNWLVWVVAEDKGLTLHALVIEAIAENPESLPVEFKGIIEALWPGGGRIDQYTFALAADALVLGELAVGKTVEMQATQAGDGGLIAHLVRVVDPAAEAKVSAIVAAITDEGGGEQTWDVIVFPEQAEGEPLLALLRVGPNTWIDERRAVAQPGLWAGVLGTEVAQNEIYADVIRLDQPVPVSLEGEFIAAASGGGAWGQINGQKVWLGLDQRARAAAISGGKAAIEGVRLGNGVIWAQKFLPFSGAPQGQTDPAAGQ